MSRQNISLHTKIPQLQSEPQFLILEKTLLVYPVHTHSSVPKINCQEEFPQQYYTEELSLAFFLIVSFFLLGITKKRPCEHAVRISHHHAKKKALDETNHGSTCILDVLHPKWHWMYLCCLSLLFGWIFLWNLSWVIKMERNLNLYNFIYKYWN